MSDEEGEKETTEGGVQAAYPGDSAGQGYVPVGPEVEETTTVEKILALRTKQVRLILLYKTQLWPSENFHCFVTNLIFIYLPIDLLLFCRMKNWEIMRNSWSSLRTSEFEFCPVFMCSVDKIV